MSELTQTDVDQDQAGFFDLFRKSHLSLPNHNGKTLEECPVCKIWFIPSPNLTGKPLESYRFTIIDMSNNE